MRDETILEHAEERVDVLERRRRGIVVVDESRVVLLAGHEIGNAGYQTTEAAVLEQFLKYARDPANGVWLDTVDAISNYIQAQRAGK